MARTDYNGAACLTRNPELWFSSDITDQRRAKATCRTCPLIEACLRDAMEREGAAEAPRRSGIYGGLGPKGRRKLRPPQPKTLSPCGTPAAFYRHRANKETPCGPCREASNSIERQRNAAQQLRRRNGRLAGAQA